VKHLDEITRKRKSAHSRLLAMRSPVYKKFVEMEEATYRDGRLTKGTKELIAVGISVVINCESCMQWHIEQAAKAGHSREEIFEAVEVGIEMGGGPATVATRFALDVLDDVFDRKTTKKKEKA
jgi:AhpD family alkylhydroperoxidase